MALFSIKQPIRYADCDPGGIVDYPNYFRMAQVLIEDWFAQSLGMPVGGEFMASRKITTPTAHLTVDFNRPSRMGEVLTWALQVEALGRSSIRLKITAAAADGAERLVLQQVIVTADATGKSVALPPELRVKAANYQTATAKK